MKKLNLFLAFGLLMLVSSTSQAQNTASASATASAHVINPISLTWQTPLAFGFVIPPPSGVGTAVMDVSSISGLNSLNYYAMNPTMGGGATRTTGGSPGPIIFLVEGELNYTYAISLPPATTPVVMIHNTSGPPGTLLVDNFFTNIGPTGQLTSPDNGYGVGAGKQYFAVGATLHIPSTATGGQYTGSWVCTVAYN